MSTKTKKPPLSRWLFRCYLRGILESSRDADDARSVDDFLGAVLTNAENVGAAGFVTIGFGDERHGTISSPYNRAAESTAGEVSTNRVGEGHVGVAPDEPAETYAVEMGVMY
jgi:hypothetical protein